MISRAHNEGTTGEDKTNGRHGDARTKRRWRIYDIVLNGRVHGERARAIYTIPSTPIDLGNDNKYGVCRRASPIFANSRETDNNSAARARGRSPRWWIPRARDIRHRRYLVGSHSPGEAGFSWLERYVGHVVYLLVVEGKRVEMKPNIVSFWNIGASPGVSYKSLRYRS